MAERTGLSKSTIGRIWKAFGLKPHRTEGVDKQRLGETGHADQERMAAREDRDQRARDHLVLAVNDGCGGAMRLLHALGRGLDTGNDVVVRLRQCCHWKTIAHFGVRESARESRWNNRGTIQSAAPTVK